MSVSSAWYMSVRGAWYMSVCEWCIGVCVSGALVGVSGAWWVWSMSDCE